MNLSPFETTPLSTLICAWGGDGENDQQQQNDQQNPKVTVEVKTDQDKDKDKSDDGDKDKPKDKDKDDDDPLADLQSKYDAEKQQRIQLQRDADKRDEEAAASAKDVEAERDDYKKKYEQLKKYVEKDAVETNILKLSAEKDKNGNPKYDWHDVDAVATFIDKNNIRLDLESNKIDGLDLELKRIAKEKPYLLVQRETTDDGGNPGGAGRSPADGQPPSGSHGTGNSRTRETDRQKLGSKFKIPGFGPGAQQASTFGR